MVYVAPLSRALHSSFRDEDMMPRILTLFLVLHWATVFSLLAALSILDAGGAEGLNAFGIRVAVGDMQDAHRLALRAAIGFGFTTCAVLFWWSLATMALSLGHEATQGDEVLRVAFSASAFLITLILIVAAVVHADHFMPVIATHVAALIASYVAIRDERDSRPPREKPSEEQVRLAARVKALDASQIATLGRFASNLHVFKGQNR